MQASGAEIPRGEERAHPFWPMLVASTAVLPFLPRVLQNEATELLLHGAVAAAVWYTARRLGVHYGTAIVAGLLFGVLPQHVAVLSAAGGRRALVAALVVFLAWGLHAGARGPGIRRTIAAPLTYLVALLVDPSVFAAPILFWAEVDLRRDVSRPLRFGAARHLPRTSSRWPARSCCARRGARRPASCPIPGSAPSAFRKGCSTCWPDCSSRRPPCAPPRGGRARARR